jgi:hypothetical protein
MRQIIIIVLITLTMGCANFAISPGVQGTVKDIDGRPITATIVLQHSQLPDKSKSTTTDEKGNFSLSPLRAWIVLLGPAVRLLSSVKITAQNYEPVEYDVDGFETVLKTIQLERK